jgi:hypothetical protein
VNGLYKLLYDMCYKSNEETNKQRKKKNGSLFINEKRNMDLIKISGMFLLLQRNVIYNMASIENVKAYAIVPFQYCIRA